MDSHSIRQENLDGVLFVTFNHASRSNPMSHDIGVHLQDICFEADRSDAVEAIVFTGGVGRDFCAGGDFSEVRQMKGGPEVDDWIGWVRDIYVGVLSINKPTIAAVDGHAVGIGFQLALCCDLRIGTSQSIFMMPELEKGIACTYGTMMLKEALGRLPMAGIVYGCRPIHADEAYRLCLLNAVYDANKLQDEALAEARRLSAFPKVAYRDTKRATNASFIGGLNEACELSKPVHRAAFAAGEAHRHFNEILSRSTRLADSAG